MRFASLFALAVCLSTPAFAASGETSIRLTPSTPALNEPFVISVRGQWSDGCVPRFQSVNGSGTTIQVDAVANPACTAGCIMAITPYVFNTTPGTVTAAGLYTVEYYVTGCNKSRTLIASQTLAISGTCPFDRALEANVTAVRAGSTATLQWCDPSVIPGADIGYSVSFYRVLMSRGQDGPFIDLGDVPASDRAARIAFGAADTGTTFFFVEAHGCNVTIAGCSGDIVLRSNIVRIDVVDSARRRST